MNNWFKDLAMNVGIISIDKSAVKSEKQPVFFKKILLITQNTEDFISRINEKRKRSSTSFPCLPSSAFVFSGTSSSGDWRKYCDLVIPLQPCPKPAFFQDILSI
ncbi:Uncharacterised protein [uncultured archaeon]|nr:Uncharacterised protein [uncultured archaeon]